MVTIVGIRGVSAAGPDSVCGNGSEGAGVKPSARSGGGTSVKPPSPGLMMSGGGIGPGFCDSGGGSVSGRPELTGSRDKQVDPRSAGLGQSKIASAERTATGVARSATKTSAPDRMGGSNRQRSRSYTLNQDPNSSAGAHSDCSGARLSSGVWPIL